MISKQVKTAGDVLGWSGNSSLVCFPLNNVNIGATLGQSVECLRSVQQNLIMVKRHTFGAYNNLPLKRQSRLQQTTFIILFFIVFFQRK